MKQLKIVALSLVAILGLTMAVLAFGKMVGGMKNVAENKTSCCADKTCCEGDTCKMNGACCDKHNNQTVSAHTKTSCCNDANCCKDGNCKMNGACCANHDACPMKNKQTQTETRKDFDVNKVAVEEGGKSCCKGKMKTTS